MSENMKKHRYMEQEKVYNEEVKDREGSKGASGEPAGEESARANMADGGEAAHDTMSEADAADKKASDKESAEAAKEEQKPDLEAEIAECRDKYLRLQAEFDNYRKRTLREKMELVQTGGRDVLLALLPVRDDVQRAVEAMEKSDDIAALRAGVNLIAQKFTEALRQRGVTEIEAKGNEFDADLHEAVAKFAAGEENKGRVIDVVQTGYMLGDKVLRFAKVVVGE